MHIFASKKSQRMPESHAKIGVLPVTVLYQIMISKVKSETTKFQFFKGSCTKSNTTYFGGYNTFEKKGNKKDKSKIDIIYKSLINEKPSDTSTILTAMHAIEKTSKVAG